MNKIKTSWEIISNSLSVLSHHKALMIFPLIQLFAIAGIIGFFVLPLLFNISFFDAWAFFNTSGSIPAEGSAGTVMQPGLVEGPRLYAFSVLTYFISMIVGTFINVAFYNEILSALNGNSVSIRRGLGLACTKLWPILVWSLLAGTVGMLIRKIQDNFGFLGQWVSGLIGVTWSVASVFVIPVIIRESDQKNPFSYLQISMQLIRRTWGEGVIGFGSLLLLGILIVAGTVAVSTRIVFWVDTLPAAIFGVVFVAATIYLLLVTSHIFRCSLYLYATEGVPPGPFDPELFNKVWKVK